MENSCFYKIKISSQIVKKALEKLIKLPKKTG